MKFGFVLALGALLGTMNTGLAHHYVYYRVVFDVEQTSAFEGINELGKTYGMLAVSDDSSTYRGRAFCAVRFDDGPTVDCAASDSGNTDDRRLHIELYGSAFFEALAKHAGFPISDVQDVVSGVQASISPDGYGVSVSQIHLRSTKSRSYHVKTFLWPKEISSDR